MSSPLSSNDTLADRHLAERGIEKKRLRLVYLCLVIACIALVTAQPKILAPENIALWLKEYSTHILSCYVVISCIRGIFFLPSTPFVMLGILLFPDRPLLVFSISILAILFCAAYLYIFARYLEFEKVLKLVGEQHFEKIEKGFGRAGVWIVFLWSFFPFVPTDAMALVAGALHMKFWYYLAALALGEILLVGFYVNAGSALFSLF